MDLQSFCATDDMREFMNAPFSVDGYTCATNGHRLLFIQDDREAPPAPELTGEIIRRMIQQVEQLEFLACPEIDFPESQACRECEGTGKCTVSECPECNGRGEVEYWSGYHDYEWDCKSCNGYAEKQVVGGKDDCPYCEGAGKRWGYYQTVNVAGVNLACHYAADLAKVDGVEVAAFADNKQLAFRAGDYHGVIMSMRVS